MAPKKAGASKRMEHPVRAQSSALLETTAAGGTGNAPDEAQGAANERSKCMSEYDYVNVIVTPKLTFQLLRRPEWKTVQDISQDELRRILGPLSSCHVDEFRKVQLSTNASANCTDHRGHPFSGLQIGFR